MPGEENDGEDATETLRRELEEMRGQMQALQAAAAAGVAAAAAPAPQPAGVPMRFGLDSVQKFDAYTKKAYAVQLMLSEVSKTHPVNSTNIDDRRLVDAFERKGLGMEGSRQFFENFRSACETTNSAKRLQTAMARAEVKNKYDAAMVIETAATMDLKVDDSMRERRAAIPWGDFTEFWAVFRAAFLGAEIHTWQTVHKSRFGHSTAVKSMSDESFVKWVSKSFLAQQQRESDDPNTPTHDPDFSRWMSTLQANLMVANCCPTLAAALFSHPEHKKLVQPGEQHKWQFVPIYDAMREIESSPAYAQAAKEKKELKASVASALAIQQQVNAMQHKHGSETGQETDEKYVESGGKGDRHHRQPVVNCYDNVCEWDELEPGHQELIKAKVKAIKDKPPVPGASGKIDTRMLLNGKWVSVPEGTPGGFVSRCYKWQHDTGEPNSFHCENPGHWVTDCPNKKKPQVNAVQPVKESVPMAGNVTMDDFNAMQLNMLQAMQHIAGGDQDIEDMIAKVRSKGAADECGGEL